MNCTTSSPCLHARHARPLACAISRSLWIHHTAVPRGCLVKRASILLAPVSRRPVGHVCSASSSRAKSGPLWNPVEVVKREQGLQSNKIRTDVREKVTKAVEDLRFRVTVGDVAARAGVKVTEADDALKALAYDSQAALEVSEQGDVVYSFPRGFRSAIQSRSLLLSALPLVRGASRVAQYLLRIAFGTALISSIAVVWLAIAVLLSSRGGDRDDRRDRGSGGMYYNGYTTYSGGGWGPRLYFDLTDLLIYLDPNYSRVASQRVATGAQLTFIEAIFSFVFGDGDPNANFDSERYTALGQLIQDRGGVVTAEEMAPFLDPPPLKPGQPRYEDESFVLPALIRFGGEPEVDPNTGGILYRFPSLQVSGVTAERVRGYDDRSSPVEVPQERTWDLTAATSGQVMGVVALGLFNVVGVVTLSGLMADPQASYALAYQGLGWIAGLLPFLQLYAAAFFGIPLFRSVFNMKTNSAITERNTARSQAVRLLKSGVRWLTEKLSAARKGGSRRTVSKRDVIFTTEKEAGEQMNDIQAKDWDQKLLSNADRRPPYPGTARGGGWDLRQPQQQQQPERVEQQAANRRDGKTARRRDYDGNWL